MWDKEISINQVRTISLRGKIYFGVGAITRIDEIVDQLKQEGVDKFLVVTGKNAYISSGAWEVIESCVLAKGVKFAVYSEVTPNPTAAQVDTAVEVARSLGAQAVIGIGGGSAIDAAKSAAIMAKYPQYTCSDLYEYKFIPAEALPVG